MEKVKIIFENDDFLVVEKPAGMTTTKEKKMEKGTLEDWLKENYPNDLARNGIVHRLDKGTSGLVLVGRKEESFDNLKKQFKNRIVKKQYYCLVGGDTSRDGSINMPIDRSKYVFGRFGVDVDGKMSITEFKLIKKFERNGKIYSLLEINLKTGRTHQIRVHMSYLKWPLVGDWLYGGEKIEGLNRPFLHAFRINFLDPTSGEVRQFEIEMPADLKMTLEKYEEKK